MVTVADIVQVMQDAGIARSKAESLDPDQSLEAQGLDSYDRMSLLTELEEHFDVELPNDIASKLKTLNQIAAHLNAAPGG